MIKAHLVFHLTEASEAWPPCMRIIVQATEVRNLRVGTLFIVTCKGGTLGREKFHAVTIPDINISKVSCDICNLIPIPVGFLGTKLSIVFSFL